MSKTHNFDICKHFQIYTSPPPKFDPMCILLKLDYAKFGVSKPLGVGSTPPSPPPVKERLTRHLYNTIESRAYWDQEITLSDCDSTIKELYFWKGNVKSLHCKKVFRRVSTKYYRLIFRCK